ncbi:hypothetical protein D8B26_002854 [Coccidioides posadasii str. Silveira]|uniref:uncharacterized protein n=1 Tax=Coccidioides posadasii (strain RMSCC 757 / Silveira) TaxID=443226 RepID=UPI001BEF79AC|nr:hypothetical protein D8B26_002854 [Coccidioides posadasii str. Silveira]
MPPEISHESPDNNSRGDYSNLVVPASSGVPTASRPTVTTANTRDANAAQQWPQYRNLFPAEKLRAIIFHHKIASRVSGEINCWTYISAGLTTVGQKEVIITIQRRVKTEGEGDFPRDPLRWFESLYAFAKLGDVVHEYQHTGVHVPNFLGRPDVKRIVLCDFHPIDNIPASYFPAECLQAIPLTEPEDAVSRRYGVSRVLSHLGASHRWFPFPPWFSRDRGSCIKLADMEGSVKDKFHCVTVRGVSAVKRGPDVTLHVSKEAAPLLRAALATTNADESFSINTVPFKDADSGLLWSNKIGTMQPQAYAAGNSTTTMNLTFLTFCLSQERCRLELVEDGYSQSIKKLGRGTVTLLKPQQNFPSRSELVDDSPLNLSALRKRVAPRIRGLQHLPRRFSHHPDSPSTHLKIQLQPPDRTTLTVTISFCLTKTSHLRTTSSSSLSISKPLPTR